MPVISGFIEDREEMLFRLLCNIAQSNVPLKDTNR